MGTQDILGFMGGLALFLYGMQMMCDGLESCAGNHLEFILKCLTDHKIKAVLVGIIVTCLIQSSSAMTVLLIGFINAELIDLRRAIWVVMGANIGTTITGQMIAFNIGAIAPLLAIIGVIMIVFFSSRFFHHIGEVIGGLGILFMGLEFMSISMIPLHSSAFFLDLMKSLSHPMLAIGIGAVFTAVIQSSSAAMGILQTLALQELISLPQASYMIFGLNIGTCMTAFMASLSSCYNAKRLTLFHLIFNIFGTFLFFILCMILPIFQWVQGFTPQMPMNQLANMHTLFNVGTTLCFLMVDKWVIKIVYKILP